MIEAVTLDVTGTLVHCPRMAEIYAEVLGRHGVGITAAQVRATFPIVWKELDCATPLGGDRFAAYPGGAKAWWGRLIERLCELLELPPPSRFAVAELFHRFEEADSWEVFEDVPEALGRLRGGGLRLAALSNFDERLPSLLERLDLARFLDEIVYSAEVGAAKPNPAIFAHALRLLGAAADRAVHVGNSPREDAEGAVAVGMDALLVRCRAPEALPSLLAAVIEIEHRRRSRRRA